jgi:hypothetical protein
MPGSVLALSEDYKNQPIEAVARLVIWEGEAHWKLFTRSIDKTILTEDPLSAAGDFYESARNYIGPLLNQAGLTYTGNPWIGNDDQTEYTAMLKRIDPRFMHLMR